MSMKKNSAIAVVGLGGIFPGANNVGRFWENIISGVDCCGTVPAQRWIAPAAAMVSTDFEPDTALSDRACLIDEFEFDVNNWPFEPDFLRSLDPLYHLVLQAAKEAVADSGLQTADHRRTGTILAAIALPTDAASTLTRETFGRVFERRLLGASGRHDPPHLSTAVCRAATVTSLPATLLANAFGFQGGAYTLDAACASSLYAVKLACDELLAGRTDVMLAGGVSRPECLYTQVGFSQLRALSPSGRCAPFDASADGLVVGEGAGVLVLKRLADAREQNDTIYAVIKGIGLSNDMRGNLLAPDTEGQLRAMRSAYTQADWSPTDIDLIECHGAGTPVGDATELNSLIKLWQDEKWNPGQCAIGSIKSMTGHLLTAAGAAGSIKTLLALHHKTLPPSLNFSEPSATSPLGNSPFCVQVKPEPWPQSEPGRPARAAVSAFGFGGINAHMLLEEWLPERKSPVPGTSATKRSPAITLSSPDSVPKVAIVGMETVLGGVGSLAQFYQLLLDGKSVISKRPGQRWSGADAIFRDQTGLDDIAGAFMESISILPGELRIPPAEIPDILVQHLLMLKAARGALLDAGLPLHQERPDMGGVIGIEFDYEATGFHLRWDLVNQVNRWQLKLGLESQTTANTEKWLADLKAALGPPLTASRTLGALGGIVASRIAREFRFGAPSFVVSQEAVSGLRALEIGVRSLQKKETRAMLVGAVDLPGDLRRVIAAGKLSALSPDTALHPFDATSPGTLPGEGAAALILKRLDTALADNDRVYAVITGIGSAGGNAAASAGTYGRSFKRALREADREPAAISLIETHGSGCPREDRAEAQALRLLFENPPEHKGDITISTLKRSIGHTGAVAGLASVVKSGCCLFNRTLTPFDPDGPPADNLLDTAPFRFPKRTTRWKSPTEYERLCAVAGAMSGSGECLHVVLEEPPAFDGPPATTNRAPALSKETPMVITTGGPPPTPPLPEKLIRPDRKRKSRAVLTQVNNTRDKIPAREDPADRFEKNTPATLTREVLRTINDNIESTTRAHSEFLELSEQITRDYAEAFALQTRMLESLAASGHLPSEQTGAETRTPPEDLLEAQPGHPVAFDRDKCLEFAIGSVAKMLGPEYAVVDSYKARVRLPDEPLMLVDRILLVEGEKLSLGSGRVVTEHDVAPDAWYLDGRRAPVCISVEAGQADLFLSGYLGIDHAVKGTRNYRLLDAKVEFHRGLPQPGDTIRYDIHIEKFIRQQETYMFFFNFRGFIGDEPFITMTDGCAGFFTQAEVKNSGGIILTEEEQHPAKGKLPENWAPPVPLPNTSYTDDQVEALRRGNLAACFGDLFSGKALSKSLYLPGGRMHLIDRVLELDPRGGRYGIGQIVAEADIHPDDWFLTCHFMDDMVMPGTLMYECCAHTLRVFLLRMGWISDKPDTCWQPVPGIGSVLRCRGPVTPDTRHVTYAVEVKEIGYGPEPYVIADAHMHADGEYIVMFRDMSMKLSGATDADIAATWNDTNAVAAHNTVLFDREKILAFAQGNPSEAFGEPYRVFDGERKIARLPRPPYFFMDRVIKTEPPPWELRPGGWIEAQYDLPADEWFFQADRSGRMPFCILLEIALQPCGWLAAYMGSALKSDQDLKFRNLGGRALLNRNLTPERQTLTMRARLAKASEAGDMIIEHFDFEVLTGPKKIYAGTTYFGFFSKQALANQVGIRGTEALVYTPTEAETGTKPFYIFPSVSPISPGDTAANPESGLAMPATALCMLDQIDLFEPAGGSRGLGFIRGSKIVNPDEWFFKAHFYQDPVIPGSLGIESFLQLLKFTAIEKWPHLKDTHRFEMVTNDPHEWSYRGQVIPKNRLVTVEAEITQVDNGPSPALYADGFLKVDDIYIYQM
ncbi:MAG: hypothetical protein GY697_06070, partial [Desulfobacterales bacterium]|nr:hypothetical protein [Desulfobacterales bacterium]